MGAQASSFDSSSEDEDSDGSSCNSSRVSRRSSHTSEDNKDDEDINNLTNFQRKIISQSSENRVACMSTVKSGNSAPYESPSLCKPQNQPLPLSHQQKQQSLIRSLRESSLLNTRMVDSSSVDVEAEKNKKLLEWELSALEADDLRSHAWYHGQQVDRIKAERLLRQYVAEEHGFSIIVERQQTEEDASDSDGANDITSDNSDSDETIDIASDSSDAGFPFEDLVDEHGVVVDPLKATSTRLSAAVKLRQRRCLNGVLPTKRPKRPRRHFYCFLVRDSLNVRPPGRYVVSCLRVDKYEDLETGHKYKTDKQLRRFRQQQQRRQRRQNRHPVLHFVVNEIILQPGTVYERSQFTFGETLPSLTSAISAAVVKSNSKYQPGFDSVPDLIRYYVGGADDNAVLSYGGGNDGVVSGTMLSRTQQSEVRIRYPCNRRRPLMTNNFMAGAATPSILPSAMGNSRLNSRCALTATPNHTEELQILSTSPDRLTEASMSSQNKFYRRRSPSPPPHSSKWMRVQSSRSSVRKTPSSIITPEVMRSSNPKVDSQSSITSVSSNLSVSTLPRQPKSSFPLPSTSGSSPPSSKRPSSSVSKTNQLQRTSSCSGMPSRNTPDLTVSDLLAASSSPFINSLRPLPCTSKIDSRLPDSRNGICRISVSVSNDGVPSLSVVDPPRTSSSVRDTFNERNDDVLSPPFKREVTSSFSQVRIRNGGYRNMIPLWYKRQFIDRPIMSSSDRHSSLNQLNNRQSQSRRRQASSNNSSIKSSSENDEDVDDDDDDDNDNEQEQQQSSSSDSSFVSTSTLKNEKIGRKRGKHRRLSNRKIVKKETEDDEDQDEEDQEVENQTHNEEDREFENQTDNEEDQEVENQTDNEEEEEVENHTDNEKEDTEEDKVSSDEQTNLHSDFIVENSSSETSENENFQKCRTRWTNTMRKGLVDILEHPELDNQNGQPIRITGTPNHDPRQRGSRQIKQAQNEDHEVKHMGTRTEFKLLTSTDQAATLGQVSPPQSCVTHCSIRSSNNNLTENMIRQWLGLQRISNQSSNSDVAVLNNEGQIPQITILPRTRRQQWQSNSYGNASEDHHLPAEEFLRENVSSSVETQLRVLKNVNHPQMDQMMLGLSIVNQEGGIAPVTKACQLNMINECSTGISSLETGAACDYVNINPAIDGHNNPVDEVDTQHGNINFLEKTHRRKKCKASKQQSNNNYNSLVGNNIEIAVDYENIISHSTDNTSDFNYENIDQTTDKKRQKIMNDFNGGSTAVADALLAVHLAIIGDPDDTGRTTVGTGKLAAALCRADGQTTVLPYRRNLTESEQAGPLLSTCPLQLLDQPGPAGRRARLDIIERFACLQYLVAMTVIVTPCLLLIGSHIKDKENLADVNFEWSLEDEYEYRRRRFYYRCAGFDSWRMSDNDSTSDDDDESYKLTANSDFDSGYSLPPREEWAVEKRHWLDLLTRHRAAVLDKWIRTAADAKQAVGDVYGYRALMSALCSDRIQSLQDAWAALRRLHTATAVAFESRLRPEFLGRREKNLVTVLGKPGTNDIDNNDVNELLQLPPNATVPDATALAVLYEHLYSDHISDAVSMNTAAASSNDIGSMKEKDPRLSSFFTSPLLLSPSPWLSLNSGISSGLGSSVGSDYGLSALHILCIQYSDWVQQSYGDDDSILPLIKSPMLQLDRFRSNFRALLRQYSGSDFCDYGDDNIKLNYVPSDKDVNLQRKENTSFHEEFNYNRNNEFAYERQYEDNVEKYGTSGDNDDCIDDDDDDDATVICCNDRNSLSTMRNDAVDTMHGDTHVSAKTENQQQTTTKNEKISPHEKDQEEDLYDRWIEDASIYNRGSAPLNIVFCTELHVRLFWPPTLFLQDINDDKNTIDHKSAIPAYALGTTYVATATAAFDNEDKSTNHVLSPLELNHIITEQLDQAAKDMRLRYKAMDDFLDKACAYSTFVAKLAY